MEIGGRLGASTSDLLRCGWRHLARLVLRRWRSERHHVARDALDELRLPGLSASEDSRLAIHRVRVFAEVLPAVHQNQHDGTREQKQDQQSGLGPQEIEEFARAHFLNPSSLFAGNSSARSRRAFEHERELVLERQVIALPSAVPVNAT